MRWLAGALGLALALSLVSFAGLVLHARDYARRALPYTRSPEPLLAWGTWLDVISACCTSVCRRPWILLRGFTFACEYLRGHDRLQQVTDEQLRREIEQSENQDGRPTGSQNRPPC